MKKIVICANIDEKSFNALAEVEKALNISDAEIHLLHYWSVDSYALEGERVAAFYPNKDQALEITAKMKEDLSKQKDKLKTVRPENIHVEVLTSNSPKRSAVEFLKENNADLVVCLTPQKGQFVDFFHSSFTNYLASHAPCNLLMIRQK